MFFLYQFLPLLSMDHQYCFSSFPHPPLFSSPDRYELFPTSSYWFSQMPHYALSDSYRSSAVQKTASHKLLCWEFFSVCPQDSTHLSLLTGLSRCFDMTCSALGFLTNFQAPESPSNELLNWIQRQINCRISSISAFLNNCLWSLISRNLLYRTGSCY